MLKIKNKIPSALTIGGKIVERIKMRNEVVWEKVVEPVDADYFYVENTYAGKNTISVKQTITGEPDSSLYTKTLQYSKDKETWTTITLSSTSYTIDLNQGEKVYFRNNEGVFNHYVIRGTEQVWTNIIGNQSHNIGGNINTLINYYTPNNLTLPQGVFCNVFRGNANLVSAENLTLQPSLDGSLPVFAYLYLFRNCTSLINPPVLIAKTLSNNSYYSMFEGCTSLNNLTVYADDVSATNCTYNWLNNVAPEGILFNYGNATYTENSPSGIPTGWVEVKPDYFYVENTYAGTNTISLTGNQSLDFQYSKDKNYWTTFKPSVSPTFDISLNQGEKLYIRGNANLGRVGLKISGSQSHNVGGNINTLINYNEPDNVVLSSRAFESLFYGDEKLTSASNLILPATSLAEYCYMRMFSGCTSLTTPPILPATNLAEYCYGSLFEGCYSLNYIKCFATDTSAANTPPDYREYCEYWVDGVGSSGIFIASDNYSQGWYWGNSGIPYGWTTVTESGNPFEPTSGDGEIYMTKVFTVYEMGSNQGGYAVQPTGSNMELPDFNKNDYCFAMMKISLNNGWGVATASMTPYLGNGVKVYISSDVYDDDNCPFSYNYDDESNYEYLLTSSNDGLEITPDIGGGNCRWVKFVKNQGTYEWTTPYIRMNFE